MIRSWSRRARGGFTLIELMIVVAITGILSMLAAYGVRKYIASAKTAEAQNSLGRLANGAVLEYEHEQMASPVLPQGTSSAWTHALCRGASGTVPSAPTMIAGRKYQSTTADWNVDSATNSGFSCLHFTIDQPQYYMYGYAASGTTSPGDSFTATANGDLNGDGVLSTFQVTGRINSAYVVNVAPNMVVIGPED